jgi:uncharacterized damage-inducible protein DinB
MELTPATASRYVHLAVEQMLAVADRLGDERVNERPLGPQTNAVAGLVTHCCGVAEFWLGHVGLGRESERVRDDEFTRTATVAELHALADAALTQIDADLQAIDAGATSAYAEGRAFLSTEDTSDASLVLHVIEELYQHLGHCELAADALLGPPA